MSKFDSKSAFIGAAVGAVVAVGAVMSMQEPLHASVDGSAVSYRQEFLDGEDVRDTASRRPLRERYRYERRAGSDNEAPRPRYPDQEGEMAEEEVVLDCVTVDVLRSEVMDTIPEKSGVMLIRGFVSDVFDKAAARCGEYVELPEEVEIEDVLPAASEKEIEVRVNNHCERFARGTVRRSTCEVLERNGERYIESQTKGYEY